MPSDQPEPAAQPLDVNTTMAQYRTELALERTHLAWVRTAFAFTTASVAIERAVAVDALGSGAALAGWDSAIAWLCLAICVVTNGLLLVATVQLWRQQRRLTAMTGLPTSGYWPSLVITAMVSTIGILAAAFLVSVV